MRRIAKFAKFVSFRPYRVNSFKIDGIEFSSQKKSEYIPNLSFSSEKINQDENLRRQLKWMAQKDSLHQDMFLIGHPGDFKRNLAVLFCSLTNKEIEYVCVSKDTTEHDFKQRREILNGNAFYVDQSAVRAAIHGRILIIDGMEKAEQNILPVLNNLLENREMTLEDGRSLISAKRFLELRQTHSLEELTQQKIIPVHEDFRVIAIGLPIPLYSGNTLDPPLRSRFQALHVTTKSIESLLDLGWKVPINWLTIIVKYGLMLKSLSDTAFLGYDRMFSMMKLIDHFHTILDLDTMRYLLNTIQVPGSKNMSESDFTAKVNEITEATLKSLDLPVDSHLKVEIDKDGSISINRDDIRVLISTYDVLRPKKNLLDSITLYQSHLLNAMILQHSMGSDICVYGPKASGKSFVSRVFADLFGYEISIFPMFKDISTRDLYQRRGTDAEGNTIWTNSILIDAMKNGSLCVLDGISEINPDVLSSLQTLITDRSIYLFDGTRWLSADTYDRLLSDSNLEILEKKRIFRIHPQFRLVCLGTIKSTYDTVPVEVSSMFNVLMMPPLSEKDEKIFLTKFSVDIDLIEKLIRFKTAYNSEFREGKLITTRDLKRILLQCEKPGVRDVRHLLQNATMSYLSQTQKTQFHQLCESLSIPLIEKSHSKLVINDDSISLDECLYKRGKPETPSLVPNPFFVPIDHHISLIKELLQDHSLGLHSMILGGQGVGKNKIVDFMLGIMKIEREYLQLHRDTTVNGLTVQPTVIDGVLKFIDSPLVNAVKHGRVLLLDEADKAPIEVVAFLKSLLEDGEMVLSDNRRISRAEGADLRIHPNFRVIVLANRPGYPFHGNNIFAECGDIFSPHYLENPSMSDEIQLLKTIGPNVEPKILELLSKAFADLRSLQDQGLLLYPYSTRELVNIVRHLELYPNDGIVIALDNIFDFDSFDDRVFDEIRQVFLKYEIPIASRSNSIIPVNLAKSHPYSLNQIAQLTLSPWTELNSTVKTFPIVKLRTIGFPNVPIMKESSLINHRTTQFTELNVSITIDTNPTNICVLNGKLHVFNIRTSRLDIYSENMDRFQTYDMYETLSIAHECRLIEMGVWNDQLLFYGFDPDGIFHIMLVDSISWSRSTIKISLPHHENFVFFNPKSMSGNKYMSIDNLLMRLKIVEGIVQFENIVISKGSSLKYLGGGLFQHEYAGETSLYLFKDEKWISRKIKNDSLIKMEKIHSDLLVKSQKMITVGNSIATEWKFIEDDVIVSQISGVAIDTPSVWVSLPKSELFCLEVSSNSNLLIFNPEKSSFRNITIPSGKILDIVPLNAEKILIFQKNMITSVEVDLDSLEAKAAYWRRYISPENSSPKVTIEFDKGFKENNTPKHGEDDDEEHYGGNTFAGGTGGRDTAGMGGYGGPYRLDKGFHIHQVPDAIKEQVSEETKELARKMGREAFLKRLREIDMSEKDMSLYQKFYKNVQGQIAQLREVFEDRKASEQERTWLKNLSNGEIDESRIVEGILGEKLIYKKRGNIDQKFQKKPKLIHFIFDVSASMYRFNSQDQRLNREMEIALLVMQSLKNFETKYKYRIYGHSGDSYSIPYVTDKNPSDEKEELRVLEKIHATTQYCLSGDTTVEAIKHGIASLEKESNYDEKIMFLFSDSNLNRHGITIEDLKNALNNAKKSDHDVQVYFIFIASFADEAIQLQKEIPNSYCCFDTSSLVQTFEEILKSRLQ